MASRSTDMTDGAGGQRGGIRGWADGVSCFPTLPPRRSDVSALTWIDSRLQPPADPAYRTTQPEAPLTCLAPLSEVPAWLVSSKALGAWTLDDDCIPKASRTASTSPERCSSWMEALAQTLVTEVVAAICLDPFRLTPVNPASWQRAHRCSALRDTFLCCQPPESRLWTLDPPARNNISQGRRGTDSHL
jgi:hypothetical protein